MKLQEISERTGIAKRTVYFYIKEGLITPSANEKNGYYDFTEEDLEKLLLIREFRKAGLSVSIIRSMLEKPVTAGYYLSLYIKQLRQRKQWAEETMESISGILDALPLHPDFHTLYRLSMEAGFPNLPDDTAQDSLDPYDTAMVNRFLWSMFIPEKDLSDYQQFLWAKLNKITNTRSIPDYRLLSDFLHSLAPGYLDRLFVQRSEHYISIASLDSESLSSYADAMERSVRRVLGSQNHIALWKQYYDSFFAPQTRISASDISDIVGEMSPIFADYRDNIHKACRIFYERLTSGERNILYSELRRIMEPQLDLECCYHGQLEALSLIPDLYALMHKMGKE